MQHYLHLRQAKAERPQALVLPDLPHLLRRFEESVLQADHSVFQLYSGSCR